MTAAFDATAAVPRTPFPFAADITAAARPVAVDGRRQLIARGDHRPAPPRPPAPPFLPEVTQVSEAILAANPGIRS